MTAHVLVTGSLFRAPEQKGSKAEAQRAAPAESRLYRHAGSGEDYFGDALPF